MNGIRAQRVATFAEIGVVSEMIQLGIQRACAAALPYKCVTATWKK